MTISFDWDKWNRSMWQGFPKNRMWGKIRSGANDNVTGEPEMLYDAAEANHETLNPVVGDVARDHRFTGYRSNVEQDAEGDMSEGDQWPDHDADKISEALPNA